MRSSEGSELGNHILGSLLLEAGVVKGQRAVPRQVLTFHTLLNWTLGNTSASQMAEQAWMVVRGLCHFPGSCTQGSKAEPVTIGLSKSTQAAPVRSSSRRQAASNSKHCQAKTGAERHISLLFIFGLWRASAVLTMCLPLLQQAMTTY